MKIIKISKSDNGIRLDKFLFKIMTAPPSEVYRSLRKKKIKINGKRTTDGAVKLNTDDMLELYINDEFLQGLGQEKMSKAASAIKIGNMAADKPDIVYEDDNIIVMNKPSGMLSQDEHGKSLEGIMRSYLMNKSEYSDSSAYKPSLCHRIDRNTSGLVIGAKNITAHRIITEKIKSKEIRKFYLCRVQGILNPGNGEINGYITKVGNNKVQFSKNKTDEGKRCELRYRVINSENSASIVEVELRSGRTHQIRASFAYIGHPLIGDVKYGAAKDGGHEFQNLEAYKLIFEFSTISKELEYLKNKIIEIDNSQSI